MGRTRDDLNDTSSHRLTRVLGLAIGGLASLVVLPDAEALLLGEALSLTEGLEVGLGGGRPVDNVGETSAKEVDRNVAASGVDDGSKEVVLLVDTLNRNSHVTMHEKVLSEETGLKGVGVSIRAGEAGRADTRELELNVVHLREKDDAKGGSSANLVDNTADGLVLDALEEVKSRLGVLTTGLNVLDVTNGTLLVRGEDAALELFGLVAHGLEVSIALVALARGHVEPTLLNKGVAD